MFGWKLRNTRLAFPLAFFGLTASSYAVDGVVLIDQNRALAGNVTPGDAPGFPITLSQPGSYKLAGNLTVPAMTNGIELTASNITIDLNGFSITTPTNQFGSGLGRNGIFFSGPGFASGIVVRNGLIEGFAGGVDLFTVVDGVSHYGAHSTLEDLTMRWGLPGSAGGLVFGPYARIRNVTSPDNDLLAMCPSVISESTARSVGVAPRSNSGICSITNNATSF